MESGAYQFVYSSWPETSRAPSVSTSPALGFLGSHYRACIYADNGNLIGGFHACGGKTPFWLSHLFRPLHDPRDNFIAVLFDPLLCYKVYF